MIPEKHAKFWRAGCTPHSPCLGTRSPPSVHDCWWVPDLCFRRRLGGWGRAGGDEAGTLRKIAGPWWCGAPTDGRGQGWRFLLHCPAPTCSFAPPLGWWASALPELPHCGLRLGFFYTPLPTYKHGRQLLFWHENTHTGLRWSSQDFSSQYLRAVACIHAQRNCLW